MNRLTPLRTQAPYLPHYREIGEERMGTDPATLAHPVPPQYKTPATPSSPHPLLRNIDLTEKTSGNTVAATRPAALAARHMLMMYITVDARCVTELRHLVMGNCGGLVSFMRIQPVAHATRMKVWLYLNRPAVDVIMASVMRNLPSAEFGAITRA